MSTLDAQTVTHARAHGTDAGREGAFTLASLADALASLKERPALAQVDEWMRRVEVSREELRPYVSFKEGTYARHRVFLCDHAELLVLCWRPGQRTPIHDHAGSFGAVRA